MRIEAFAAVLLLAACGGSTEGEPETVPVSSSVATDCTAARCVVHDNAAGAYCEVSPPACHSLERYDALCPPLPIFAQLCRDKRPAQ